MIISSIIMDKRSQLLSYISNCTLWNENIATEEGRCLNNYINLHEVFSMPSALSVCIELLYFKVKEYNPDVICGLVTGACPLVTGLELYSYNNRLKKIRGVYIRKEKKGYGVSSELTSLIDQSEKVVIVDDVTGMGNAANKCIDILQRNKIYPKAFISIIDREEGAENKIKSNNIDFKSIFKLKDLEKPSI